jgi:hypothetical protein
MTDENDEIDEDGIKQRWEQVGSKLDERGRRLWAAGEVQAAGHGALKVVSRITGLARSTINRGEDDLDEGPLPGGRVRRKGGGGRPLSESDPTLVDDLKRLVEPATLGSPVQPLRWVSKSLREAGAGAPGDGAQDQRQHGRQAAHGRARLLAPGEPQGGRRLAPSRPRRAEGTLPA